MSSWELLFVVISYMIIGLDAVAKMLQRCCKEFRSGSMNLRMGTVTFWRNHLGFRYPLSRHCSLLCEVILFTEVQNLSSAAVSQRSLTPLGSGLTRVSLILLLQLMREVLSDPREVKKTTEKFGYKVQST